MADHPPRQVGPWIEDFQAFPQKGEERTEAPRIVRYRQPKVKGRRLRSRAWNFENLIKRLRLLLPAKQMLDTVV